MRKTWNSCTKTKFLLFVMNTTHEYMHTKYFLLNQSVGGHSIGYIYIQMLCVPSVLSAIVFYCVIEMKTQLAQTSDMMGLQILAEYGIPLEVLLIIMSKV